MESRTDEELVHATQRGEVEAFGALVERYEGKLRRYARKFLLGKEDVEDLVQDVFMNAYLNIRSFDATRRFSPWVYRIAHNAFISALKRRERYRSTFIDLDTILPILSAGDRADDASVANEEKELVLRALDRIDPKYREPLVLFYEEEMDYGTIADVLGVPVATVGVRLKRGREAARRAIRDIDPTFTRER